MLKALVSPAEGIKLGAIYPKGDRTYISIWGKTVTLFLSMICFKMLLKYFKQCTMVKPSIYNFQTTAKDRKQRKNVFP